LSSLDSTPATACWSNDPHLEVCFAGAAIAKIPAQSHAKGRVAKLEVEPDHASQVIDTASK
jgi:hypothetical protein